MQVAISDTQGAHRSRLLSLEFRPIDGGVDGGAVFVGDGDVVFSVGDDGGDEAEVCWSGGYGLDEFEGDDFVSGEAAGGGDG